MVSMTPQEEQTDAHLGPQRKTRDLPLLPSALPGSALRAHLEQEVLSHKSRERTAQLWPSSYPPARDRAPPASSILQSSPRGSWGLLMAECEPDLGPFLRFAVPLGFLSPGVPSLGDAVSLVSPVKVHLQGLARSLTPGQIQFVGPQS